MENKKFTSSTGRGFVSGESSFWYHLTEPLNGEGAISINAHQPPEGPAMNTTIFGLELTHVKFVGVEVLCVSV